MGEFGRSNVRWRRKAGNVDESAGYPNFIRPAFRVPRYNARCATLKSDLDRELVFTLKINLEKQAER